MSEIVAHTPDPSCYLLFSGPGIEESQWVGPDPFLSRAPRAGEVRREPEVTRRVCPRNGWRVAPSFHWGSRPTAPGRFALVPAPSIFQRMSKYSLPAYAS
jgi:hypothetical protein